MALEVDREQVLAYRVAAHGLERAGGPPSELAVLDLGVQDTPSGSARLAVAARSPVPFGADPPVLVWSFRGAPHLHRTADLGRLAAALWPLSDADATARISSSLIKAGARLGVAAFTAAADAMRAVVTVPRPRSEVSTEVSARIPESLTYQCRACAARHISGALFQQVGLAAGVRLEPGTAPAVLAPIDGRAGTPRRAAGTAVLLTAYLRLHGPATLAEAAKFLGTTQAVLRPVWLDMVDTLAEVLVDGRRAWLPADRVDALRAARPPRLVRLLPPSDPYLQARDRALMVPDKTRQKALWQVLGNPGALLADGEIAGVWRARKAGRNGIELTVTPFEPLPARLRAAVEDEAGHVAAARGVTDVRVLFGDQPARRPYRSSMPV